MSLSIGKLEKPLIPIIQSLYAAQVGIKSHTTVATQKAKKALIKNIPHLNLSHLLT